MSPRIPTPRAVRVPFVRTALVSISLAILAAIAVLARADSGGGSQNANPPARVVGWNNLGMHCMDDDFSVFATLPPFNTIQAQVIVNGQLVTNASGYTVTYEAVADPTGSINKTAAGKTNFWAHVNELFGASVPVDQGLTGHAMPGASNTPQLMGFDAATNSWMADGIPITPYDDAMAKNTYPLMKIVVRDAGNQPIANTNIVLPVSDELTCVKCHASNSVDAAKPAAGWVNDADPKRDYRLNILRLHDERNAADPLYAPALATAGYNASGLYANVTVDGHAVLCAKCHGSNALGTSNPNLKTLTEAIHGRHASVVNPDNGMTLDQVANRAACYLCHPGSKTRCLRGAMGASVASDGTMAMQCQSCHGNMSKVGAATREGWLDEPSCQQCHSGTATNNSGKIRYTSAFDAQGNPRVPADLTFATDSNTPLPGKSLYRFSDGHGGLQCSACHGSTHAEFPSSHANDNLQSIALQGHDGMLVECSTCHGTSPNTVNGGPHGMHPVGQAWVSRHPDVAEEGGATQCKKCHGADYRGTVLSRAQGDRTLSSEFGTKKLWNGFQVGCYLCHNGPGGEGGSSNHAPVVHDKSVQTDNATPKTFKLSASDSDGNALTLRVVRQPSHGTVGIAGKDATYFPDGAFAGQETFTFAAWDGKSDSNLGTVTVTVSDGTCPAVIAPVAADYDVSGGLGAIDVTIGAQCDWTATVVEASATWLHITSGSAGTGPGVVQYTVDANAGVAVRKATILVKDVSFAVAQGGSGSANLVGTWKKLASQCAVDCKLNGVLRVENIGDKKAKASKVKFYLSSDATLDGGDSLLKTRPVAQLKPGKAEKIKLKKTLTLGQTTSGKFVIAVVDANDDVVESDETDDVAVFGPLP